MKYLARVISVIISIVFFAACSGSYEQEDTDSNSNLETITNVSWASFYRNVEELARDSDFIGLVQITAELGNEQIVPDGFGTASESGFAIPLTFYSAKVLDGIMYTQGEIEIVMTGKRGEVQVSDDPLLGVGDTWFIFARHNNNGAYTILGGPQGRFAYNKDNNTISSLSYILSGQTRLELEENGIFMTELNLSEVNTQIAALRDG
ncbi:MAG: hypothetical protein FWH17_04690 [Oscillospiraceae bacterium]|nr:hypothetical protein [Oscillospiraceae bacterium]